MSRRKRRILFGLMLFGLLVGAALVVARAVANGRLEAEMAFVRSSGGPVVLARAAPPQVADEENAAVLLEQAFAQFDDEPFDRIPFEPFQRWYGDAWAADEETAQVIAAWVERNKPALALIARALERPACRFDFDWSSAIDMEYEPIAILQGASRRLMSRAVLEARSGAYDRALGTCGSLLRLGEAGGRDPLLIMLLVRMGLEQVALKTAQEVLARGTPSAETLRAFARDLAATRYDGVLPRTLRVERAFGISWAAAIEEDPDAADAFEKLITITPPTSTLQDVLRWTLPTTMARFDHAYYLQLMRRALPLTGRPYLETRADWEAFDEDLRRPPWFNHNASGACGMLHLVARKSAIHRARLDLARLALAIELYGIAHKRLPPALDALGLDALPTDRFRAAPYTYRLTDEGAGFLLYSVGPNLQDDDGVENEDDPQQGDLVWRRPAR